MLNRSLNTWKKHIGLLEKKIKLVAIIVSSYFIDNNYALPITSFSVLLPRYCFFFLISFFCFSSLPAQPIIQNTIFPEVGDTLLMASDNLPEGIAVFPYKGEQTWDFMDLHSAFSKKIEVEKVAQYKGATAFKSADIVMEDLAGRKNYYHLHKNELKLIGITGIDPYNLGMEVPVSYQPAFSILKTPLAYGDIANNSGRYTCELAANELPISLLYSLPVLPDSLRFISTVETSREMDAYGHLVLPDNSFEVLRERRITATKTRLEVKVGVFPWRDITDEFYSSLFSKETVQLSYHFYSNETILPVAEVLMKPDGINAESVVYKVTDPTSTTHNTSSQPDIYAYPNPAINEVRFEFSNLSPASYSLKIFNILGMEMQQETYMLSGFSTIKWDVSTLRKGTYLYSLTKEDGKTIATRRLMVIRP